MTESDLKCPRCGDPHEIIACPYVKAIEFEDGNGQMIRRLEFLTPADYGPQKPVAPKPVAADGDDYRRLGERK